MATKEYNQQYYQVNRKKILAQKREYIKANPEKLNLKNRKYYNTNTEFRERQQLRMKNYKWNWRIKHMYGITPEQYEEMLIKQDNKCLICKSSEWGSVKPNIDHDHITGKVRGILCRSCNHGLGQFKDSVESLRNAIIYLQQNDGAETTTTN